MVVIRDGDIVHIRCDKCAKPIPTHAEILNAGGLIRMGWKCSGGTHECPDCREPETTAAGQ